jgi:hypothetical protein
MPKSLKSWKTSHCFPEPSGGERGAQLAQLVGVAESHGFESADFGAFFLS